jgi:hypothetical protein
MFPILTRSVILCVQNYALAAGFEKIDFENNTEWYIFVVSKKIDYVKSGSNKGFYY